MNAYEVTAVVIQALEEAGLGKYLDTIFRGRIQASQVKSGLWSVRTLAGGQPEGGNAARFKNVFQLEIRYHDDSTKAIYEKDTAVQTALNKLPQVNPQILSLIAGPVQDAEVLEGEQRAGIWQLIIKTFVPNWSD